MTRAAASTIGTLLRMPADVIAHGTTIDSRSLDLALATRGIQGSVTVTGGTVSIST